MGAEELPNPIDELLEDLTLDKVVDAAAMMEKEDLLVRIRALRMQRARWVAKGRRK